MGINVAVTPNHGINGMGQILKPVLQEWKPTTKLPLNLNGLLIVFYIVTKWWPWPKKKMGLPVSRVSGLVSGLQMLSVFQTHCRSNAGIGLFVWLIPSLMDHDSWLIMMNLKRNASGESILSFWLLTADCLLLIVRSMLCLTQSSQDTQHV